MQIIFRPRGRGKTHDAIELAARTGAYLIVLDDRAAVMAAEEARRRGLDLRYPVTFLEFTAERMAGSHVRNIVIDNADMLLAAILGRLKIEAITLTDMAPLAQSQERE